MKLLEGALASRSHRETKSPKKKHRNSAVEIAEFPQVVRWMDGTSPKRIIVRFSAGSADFAYGFQAA